MDIKRKQHILPESHLKRWVDPATKVAGKTPMVWTFTKGGKTKQPKPPASGHFWRDYFYDLGTFVSAKARIEKDSAQAHGKPIPDTSVSPIRGL